MDEGTGRRRRRHSAQFKADAVAAARQPGVSIAATAMARSINANLLRRWILEAERAPKCPQVAAKPVGVSPKESFIALSMPVQRVDETPIQIEIRRGAMTLCVQWPRSAVHECAIWLRELLK